MKIMIVIFRKVGWKTRYAFGNIEELFRQVFRLTLYSHGCYFNFAVFRKPNVRRKHDNTVFHFSGIRHRPSTYQNHQRSQAMSNNESPG